MTKTPFRRVAVTGIGAITSLGHSANETWQRLIAGESGLRHITRFPTDGFTTTIAGEVDGIAPDNRSRVAEFAVRAAREAVRQSGAATEQAAVLLGTAFGGIEEVLAGRFDRSFAWLAADAVRTELDARGPVLTYGASFTGAANAIGEAFERIRHGRCDVALAGGSDAAIVPPIVAGFIAMGATSANSDDPRQAVKPFAADRDGCAIGEGVAMLVLETYDAALARGATVLAEIVGYGTTADAFHVVALPDDGDGIVRAMRTALAQAELLPEEVGYINAHGTGTQMNDLVETGAMKQVFGAAARAIPISSTKPATGHTLGAAGALEAVIGIQVLRTRVVPPTLNLHHPDPACDLNYVPLVARHVNPQIVMSNSMGFGGHAASLVFRRGNGDLAEAD